MGYNGRSILHVPPVPPLIFPPYPVSAVHWQPIAAGGSSSLP